MLSGNQVGIVLPCYNEVEGLPDLIAQAEQVSSLHGVDFLFVDNGSTDGTFELFDSYQSKDNASIDFLRIPENKGYGHGVKRGIMMMENPYIGWTHADLQTDLVDLVNVIEIIKVEDHDERGILVKGFRRGRPIRDAIFSYGMAAFASVMLKTRLIEINAQPTVFSRHLVDNIDVLGNGFELDLDVYYLAKKNGFKVSRVDVAFNDRRFGKSSWNTSVSNRIKFIIRNAKLILKKRIYG